MSHTIINNQVLKLIMCGKGLCETPDNRMVSQNLPEKTKPNILQRKAIIIMMMMMISNLATRAAILEERMSKLHRMGSFGTYFIYSKRTISEHSSRQNTIRHLYPVL